MEKAPETIEKTQDVVEKPLNSLEKLRALFKERTDLPASEVQTALELKTPEELDEIVSDSRIFEFSANKERVLKKQIIRFKLFVLTSEEEISKSVNELLPYFDTLFTHIPYLRFNKNLGHLILFEDDFLKNQLITEQKIKIEDGEKTVVIEIREPNFEDRRHFSSQHGRHMEGILKSRYGKRIHFAIDGITVHKNGIYLGPQKFKSLKELKSVFGKLLKNGKVGEEIENPEATFLKELLKFHEKSDSKLKDFDHFEVGMHPEHQNTRCFLVVKTDGTKDDFSFNKCIKQISGLISG